MAAYASSVTLFTPRVERISKNLGILAGQVNITNYNSTTTEETDITRYFRPSGTSGLEKGIVSLQVTSSENGYQLGFNRTTGKFKAYYKAADTYTPSSGTIDDNDSAATLGHALYVVPTGAALRVPDLAVESSATGLVKDSDTAAADGVAIYVVVDDPNWSSTYQLGHFEFVSPTNANGSCTIANGVDTLTLFDDDAAATNGVVIRAVAAGAGIEATTAASKDIIVPTSTGKFIHVNHATTGSTPTLYFDEDAANTYERIQGVIVDNADEPYKLLVATGEKAPDTIAQGIRTAAIVTSGPKPFTYTVGSGGPELTIPARPDAASLEGAVALYVQAAGAGFNAANFGKEDVFVPLANGEYIKVAYAASPAGVQVYGYPEGASSDLKILAVVVDNADETFSCDQTISQVHPGVSEEGDAAAFGEVANDTDLGTFDFLAIGFIAP